MSDAQLDLLLYRHGNSGAIGRLKMALAKASAGGENDAGTLATMGRLSALLDRSLKWQKPDMPVKGADLLAAGFSAGPEIGEKLAALEERWVESQFRLGKDELLKGLKH